MKAALQDLKANSKKIFNLILQGEEIVITYHGKPTASLIPFINNLENEKETYELFDIWKDNDSVADVDQYIRKVRKGRFNAD